MKNFDFKIADTGHFIGLTNFVTKKDYTDFFNRYLLGTEWPKERFGRATPGRRTS